MIRLATFSEDGLYRYSLSRIWQPTRPKLAIIMLNPSTADASKDDPTIRKCIWFAGSWHYGGCVIVNLCASYIPKNRQPQDFKWPITTPTTR